MKPNDTGRKWPEGDWWEPCDSQGNKPRHKPCGPKDPEVEIPMFGPDTSPGPIPYPGKVKTGI